MSEQDNTFYLGLCMAGAVSAGAYTAGVMDFLLEALEEWEKRRDEPNVPTHRIKIPIMGGASAGGMTGIMTAAALPKQITPVHPSQVQKDLMQSIPENPFYHSWVDMTDPKMLEHMLSNNDLQGGPIPSIFNSNFIDKIGKRAISAHQGKSHPRPYFSDDLQFFCTLSNLEGFEKDVNFRASETLDEYLVSWHNDFGCFRLSSLSEKEAHNYRKKSDYDGWIPVNFRNPESTGLQIARDAALATGAFPAGLQSRKLTRLAEDINQNPWIESTEQKTGSYTSYHVDGGMINNEPFVKVREKLLERTGQTPEAAGNFETSKGTVMMIDPFPSKQDTFEGTISLFPNMLQTLSAMIGQLRVKPEILEPSFQDHNAFRYLIAPSRQKADKSGKIKGDYALAGGFLGGFGGFLHKEFRIHDFFLGRANCEKFLRHYFTMPVEPNSKEAHNLIFKNGYAKVKDKTPYLDKSGKNIQIIPIFSKERDFPLPTFKHGGQWPVRQKEEIEPYYDAIKNRAHALIKKMARNTKWYTRWLIAIGNWIVLSGTVARNALRSIKRGMKEWKLLRE